MDIANYNGITQGQVVPARLIPDIAREVLCGETKLQQPIGQIEELVKTARRNGEDMVRLTPAGLPELIEVMNYEMNKSGQRSGQYIERVYWSVSISALIGVLDFVRTNLVLLVAEIRASTPRDSELPTREAIERATQVVVSGHFYRVNFAVSGEGNAVAEDQIQVFSGETQPESRARKIMWWIIGIVSVVGVITPFLIKYL